uniref:Uncharacterized protein n=1 Tax=viral metagenome TaxID=1070528 RepID=A0A6C0IBR2_9ZZZZ
MFILICLARGLKASALLTQKVTVGHRKSLAMGQNATELLTSKGALHPEKFGQFR